MMGFLLDKILLAPIEGLLFIGKAVHERMQDEDETLSNNDRLHERLLQLQWEYSRGEISEAEFREQETLLSERLLAANVE